MHCKFWGLLIVFCFFVCFFFFFFRAVVNFSLSKELALMANKIEVLLLLFTMLSYFSLPPDPFLRYTIFNLSTPGISCTSLFL